MSRGRDLVIEPAPGAEESELRLIMLGPALAVLLHQRGLLVLHASAAALTSDGSHRAVAFMGDKGAGKSTTAAAMCARGHGLIADDLVAVDLSGAVPHVWPGFPHLKLWPEAAASTLDDRATAASLARVHSQLEKRSRPVRGEFPRAGSRWRGFTSWPMAATKPWNRPSRRRPSSTWSATAIWLRSCK